jgi:hypothetical protein
MATNMTPNKETSIPKKMGFLENLKSPFLTGNPSVSSSKIIS